MNRRNAVLATAAAMVLLAACDQSATDVSTSGSTNLAVQSALIGGGSAFPDGGPQPAIMSRLVEAAFAKIRKDNGADSAKAARAKAEMARPFQAQSTLSSRSGFGRRSRCASSTC